MYEERVKKGARLLDRVHAGWAERIEADRLAMESCDRCILGQLYGSYFDGWREAVSTLPHDERLVSSGHGFTLTYEEQSYGTDSTVLRLFAALADTWRAEIRARTVPGSPA